MLAVRTASAGKIAPFGLLPSRTGQPSHHFFLCGVGAELQFALFANQPTELATQRATRQSPRPPAFSRGIRFPFELFSTAHSNYRMQQYYSIDNTTAPRYTIFHFAPAGPVSLLFYN